MIHKKKRPSVATCEAKVKVMPRADNLEGKNRTVFFNSDIGSKGSFCHLAIL